jgi:hypothetical protein
VGMVDMHIHGRPEAHHKFTVASMVSRRVGRMLLGISRRVGGGAARGRGLADAA